MSTSINSAAAVRTARDIASRRHEHAAKCKKSIDDCVICKLNIQWFGELPLPLLSQVLQENGGTNRRRLNN